jgi:hypothetical protein
MLAIEFRRGNAAHGELDLRLVHSNAYYLTVASFLNRNELNESTGRCRPPCPARRKHRETEDVLAATRRCGKRDSDNGDLEVDYLRI